MAAGSSNFAAVGVLTQLSKASNSSSDEQHNEVDDTLSIISSTSGVRFYLDRLDVKVNE